MVTIKSLLLPMCTLFAPASNSACHPVVNKVYVVQELKEKFTRKNEVPVSRSKTLKTPTLSYLEAVENGHVATNPWVPSPKDTIRDYKKNYSHIIDQAISREQELCNDYYVFYHGHPNSFTVFHDFLKEFNTFMNISGKKADFEFMRMLHLAEKEIDANAWLIKNGPKYDINTLIFVNLSLFGNINNQISQSFAYFKDNLKTSLYMTEQLFKDLFLHHGLNTSYIKELIELNKKYATKEGTLIQFFIPKDKVDQYVYLGSGSAMTYGSPIVNSVWDSNRGYHTKIAPILDKYIENIASIPNFDSLQACILSSQGFLLNQDQDIKIFKYMTIKDADRQNYITELKEICDRMFTEWIQTQAYKNLENTVLGRLLKLIK